MRPLEVLCSLWPTLRLASLTWIGVVTVTACSDLGEAMESGGTEDAADGSEADTNPELPSVCRAQSRLSGQHSTFDPSGEQQGGDGDDDDDDDDEGGGMISIVVSPGHFPFRSAEWSSKHGIDDSYGIECLGANPGKLHFRASRSQAWRDDGDGGSDYFQFRFVEHPGPGKHAIDGSSADELSLRAERDGVSYLISSTIDADCEVNISESGLSGSFFCTYEAMQIGDRVVEADICVPGKAELHGDWTCLDIRP